MYRRLGLPVLAVFLAVALIGCRNNRGPQEQDLVLGVTVYPNQITVERGESQQFEATVDARGNASREVRWEVAVYTGGPVQAGTSISETGMLTVALGEPAEMLIVTAISVFDETQRGTAVVTVIDPGVVVITVGINPGDAAARPGENVSFTATVDVSVSGSDIDEATIPRTVTWHVDGNFHADTGIRNITDNTLSATLVIAADETAETLTVRVASTENLARQATATVTVNREEPVSYVWIVGSIVDGGWDSFPGTSMDQGYEAGTFTWSGEIAAGGTFRFNLYAGTTGWGSGSWFAPDFDGKYVEIGRNYKTRFDNPDGDGRAWRIRQAGYYTITLNPDAGTMYVEREGVPVEAVWLVGHMAASDWTLPGEPMSINADDGTFTWSGNVTASNYFRFNLDAETTGWGNGTWFVPPGGNRAAELGSNDMVRLVNPTIGSGDAWYITQSGWYVFTVCPGTETLYVARPVVVDSITIVSPPAQLVAGGTYSFTATLTGRNVDDTTVTWTVEGGVEGTGFGTGGYANRLTVAANDAGETLTITASANGQTDRITRVVVDPANLGGAVINLVVRDEGAGLEIVDGIPSVADKPVISTGGNLPSSVTFAVQNPLPGRAYEWLVSGVRKQGHSVTFYAANFGIGRHTVRLIVTDENGVVWSMPQLLHFNVVQYVQQ